MSILNTLKIIVTGKRLRKSQAEWRLAVIKRNGRVCAITGKGGVVEVHHLFSVSSFPFFAESVWNGVVLSVDEHAAYHSWMGGTSKPTDPLSFWFWAYFVRSWKGVAYSLLIAALLAWGASV